MAGRQDWRIIEGLGNTILANVEGDLFEIGLGRSTPIFVQFAKKFNRDLYCFDMVKRKCRWAKERGAKVFKGRSLDFLDQFPDISIAMGLIDGDHRYETVIQEFNFFLPKLTYGGVIFLHDTYPPEKWVRDDGRFCGEVYKVRQELESRNDIQIFTWPYTAINCGISMVMKKELNRSYCRE